MLYVYNIEKFNDKMTADKIVNECKGVRMNPESFSYILSKTEKITIDNETIDCKFTFEDWYLSYYDGVVELIDNLEVTKEDIVNILVSKLEQPIDDSTKVTYLDTIYNAKNPYLKIIELENDFLILKIGMIVAEIESRFRRIAEEVNEGTFEWG